jgi:hypothetical protein
MPPGMSRTALELACGSPSVTAARAKCALDPPFGAPWKTLGAPELARTEQAILELEGGAALQTDRDHALTCTATHAQADFCMYLSERPSAWLAPD